MQARGGRLAIGQTLGRATSTCGVAKRPNCREWSLCGPCVARRCHAKSRSWARSSSSGYTTSAGGACFQSSWRRTAGLHRAARRPLPERQSAPSTADRCLECAIACTLWIAVQVHFAERQRSSVKNRPAFCHKGCDRIGTEQPANDGSKPMRCSEVQRYWRSMMYRPGQIASLGTIRPTPQYVANRVPWVTLIDAHVADAEHTAPTRLYGSIYRPLAVWTAIRLDGLVRSRCPIYRRGPLDSLLDEVSHR